MHRRAGGSLALTSNELSLAASTEKLMLDVSARGDPCVTICSSYWAGVPPDKLQVIIRWAPDSIYMYSAVLVVVHIGITRHIFISMPSPASKRRVAARVSSSILVLRAVTRSVSVV